MTSAESSEEVCRIKAVYERRALALAKDHYSLFNPRNLFAVQELEQQVLALLKRRRWTELQTRKILEIGCGSGFWLREFIKWGAQPENVAGIDLISGRVVEARRLCPIGTNVQCGNAAKLECPDGYFDLVFQCTVFTSILDPKMKREIAGEMLRVLRPDGFILWYDFHVNNPRNAEVRGIKETEIHRLFPNCKFHLRRITLAPPLGRIVAPISPFLYCMLSGLSFLCTHYLGLFEKQ